MTYRVVFRMSLNKDTGSIVRNSISGTLGAAKIPRRPKTTATWEASGLPASALTTVARVLQTLANPSAVQGADKRVAVDHVWLYVDRG